MQLEEFQEALRREVRGIEHPRVAAALALAEECGEVMRAVLDQEVYGHDARRNLEGELGDVLLALAEVAERYELSLADVAAQALERLSARAPKWREELAGRLALLREKWDATSG